MLSINIKQKNKQDLLTLSSDACFVSGALTDTI